MHFYKWSQTFGPLPYLCLAVDATFMVNKRLKRKGKPPNNVGAEF